VGVAVPLQGVVVEKHHPREYDGSHYCVLVSRTTPQPQPDSDEINRAYEEGWVGTAGYIRQDGSRQRWALAFIGDTRAADGTTVPEIFIVDLPEALEEYAKAAGMTTVTLNRKIVRRCGYTFFQLQKMGKIFNACALLHFPDLNIQYISDYLGFTNIEDFYRVFKRYMNVSVREYQKQNVGNGMQMHSEEEALQILVYLILNFHDPFQMKEMEKVLKKNAHLLERRAREVFGRSVLELLEEVRIQISCSYLVATDRTVTQISSDVGFGSISSFQRSFAKYMNQTPSEYRRFHRCK
jgi:AraC-like DNA-binding protein